MPGEKWSYSGNGSFTLRSPAQGSLTLFGRLEWNDNFRGCGEEYGTFIASNDI
jgi:hypothetical protein